MRKLVKKFKGDKGPTRPVPEPRPWPNHDVVDPKYFVPNPPNPWPAPPPPPGPINKGLAPEGDVGTFSGLGSWIESFKPDPAARGVVEVAAQPVHGQTAAVHEVLSLEEGWPPEFMIRLTLDNLKKPSSQSRFTVLIIGPWFMTLQLVNQLLAKHGYLELSSAKHGIWASRNWNGDEALPTDLEIPVIDGPSRYDPGPGEGPLMSKTEQFGAFVDNLRRLRVRCHEGKVIATSFPGELEISFNRTLRLPEDGKTHNQPVRLGGVTVNSMAGLAKKLEASGNASLVDMARKGGVFFPLYQREAMFLSFKARRDAFAVRVFVGGVNAVSGLPWNAHPGHKVAAQDYLSVPPQRYLDGVCVAKDVVKQFVAMPLGSGYSVEKQVTGKETVGGMQLEIIPGYRWAVHVPASEHAGPQSGPYFPGLEQTPQRLGVKMVVLSEHPSAVSSSGKQGYGTDSEDWLVANGRRPIYMRHLYQSQLQHPQQPPYQQTARPTDFHPGLNVRMTAVYRLQLTLMFLDSTSMNQNRRETVEWAPWWTLDECFTEHRRADSQATGKPLGELELYHAGARLLGGSSTLQEQGVVDGDHITAQQPVPPYYGYPGQLPYSYGGPSSHSNTAPYPQSQQAIGQQQGYEPYQPAQQPQYQAQEPVYQQHSAASEVPSSYMQSPASPAATTSIPPYQQAPDYPPPPQQSTPQESWGSKLQHAGKALLRRPVPHEAAPPPPRMSVQPSAYPAGIPPQVWEARYPQAQSEPAASSPTVSGASPGYQDTWSSAPSMSDATSPAQSHQQYGYSPVQSQQQQYTPSPVQSYQQQDSSPAPNYQQQYTYSPPQSQQQSAYSPAPNYQQQYTSPPARMSATTPPPQPQTKPQDQTGWAMGIAAGAKMHQAIHADPFPASAWCTRRATVVSVQILNSVAYEALTGMLAPATPITAEMYVAQGLPFLAAYDEKGVGTDGAANLAGIKGVGDIDADGGPVGLGVSAAGGGKVGCTCCGKMLCDSILRPCNHAFCASCIRGYMTYGNGPGAWITICRICNTRATKLIGFSAPMALPGEDVVDLSDAKIITTKPLQGAVEFHSIHELSAVPYDSGTGGYHIPYEMQG
ncbi:hypothetical protein B0H67DRAFT_655359 [Lasiosphaeris hirsuta]|uniref:RING-type domain-containing protein n=1 Tax=Lasiosphaeris hirsuta TaxID=260670 RepID=A0AA40BDA9_9PEZI|nr:hypothetical protein B0H67DRAFT_655359 [Lasiosphaeris hirsuta]